MKELRAVVSDVATLSFRVQELEQSKFKALQTEMWVQCGLMLRAGHGLSCGQPVWGLHLVLVQD